MAVVNSPYVGIARGRLGEGVFSRVKGQTTIRGYNPSPANPRSVPQQAQRAQFSSAVKFFSRGIQNFFKFAFENKAEKESDYNAFMRYNANAGMFFGPAQNADPTYPALGKFIMTKGSLPPVDCGKGMVDPIFSAKFSGSNIPATVSSLGQLSTLLLDCGYQQGDIVTFCFIQTDWAAGERTQPLVGGQSPAVWSIKQFTIDTTSDVLPPDLNIDYVRLNSGAFEINMGQEIENEFACAGCVCVSRPTLSGLKVSSSVLWLNTMAQVALLFGQSDAWKAIVMEAWRTSSESILQGSRSVNKILNAGVDIVLSVTLPATIEEGSSFDIWFSKPVTLADVAEHMVLITQDGEELTGTASSGWVAWSWDSDAGTVRLTLDSSNPTKGQMSVLQGDSDLDLAAITWQ